MKTFVTVSLGVCLLAGVAVPASAQWKLNEVVADTLGSPNHQYVELYNPTPNQSVNGLTLIGIDTLAPVPQTLGYRLDLTGSAVGNYFLLGDSRYSSVGGRPAVDQSLGSPSGNGVFPADTYQFVLVSTADVPGGWVVGTTVVTNADFSNGTQIIDQVALITTLADVVLFSTPTVGPDAGFNPTGAERATDGSGAWQMLTFNSSGVGALPVDSTPKADNSGATAVSDWTAY